MKPSPARERVSSLFHTTFGIAPAVIASAPGRVNLIGEHLDYNGGPVLPFAIDRRTWVAVGPGEDVEMISSDAGGAPVRRLPNEPARGHWSDYVVGVIRELGAGTTAPPGCRIAVVSEIEAGAGLSSSAALTVATAAALSRLAAHDLDHQALVDAAFHAEYNYVGVHCGRMDQTVVAHAVQGTAIVFDTATGDRAAVPFPYECWIIPTGVAHVLADGGYNARRSECEAALEHCRRIWPDLPSLAALDASRLPEALATLPAPLDRRLRHVVTETGRTRQAARVLQTGDLPALGRLLVAGHQSLRLDFESSVGEADFLVELVVSGGAHGARLTGAGWGGSVVMLAPEGEGCEIVVAAGAAFDRRYGRTPAAWPTRASGGVSVERAA